MRHKTELQSVLENEMEFYWIWEHSQELYLKGLERIFLYTRKQIIDESLSRNQILGRRGSSIY